MRRTFSSWSSTLPEETRPIAVRSHPRAPQATQSPSPSIPCRPARIGGGNQGNRVEVDQHAERRGTQHPSDVFRFNARRGIATFLEPRNRRQRHDQAARGDQDQDDAHSRRTLKERELSEIIVIGKQYAVLAQRESEGERLLSWRGRRSGRAARARRRRWPGRTGRCRRGNDADDGRWRRQGGGQQAGSPGPRSVFVTSGPVNPPIWSVRSARSARPARGVRSMMVLGH